MFTATLITFAVISIFAGSGIHFFCEKRRMKSASDLMVAVVLAYSAEFGQ